MRLQDGLTAANSAENDVLNDLEVVEQDDAPGKSVDLSGPVMPPELEGEQGAVTPDAPKKAKAQWRR